MIIIIQCAASKQQNAGYLRRQEGQKVLFVADPRKAPTNERYIHAHPDDISDTGNSWRKELLNYNDAPGNNPFGLLPAWKLYKNRTYGLLAEHYGLEKLYILSAGWGLIPANFLTPCYDITFSNQADTYKRRRKRDDYRDLQMLPTDTREEIVCFVSQGYIPLLNELTKNINAPKRLFYRSEKIPYAPGFKLYEHTTTTRTNWHYECARKFMSETTA